MLGSYEPRDLFQTLVYACLKSYSIYFNRIRIKQVVTRASGEKLHHFVTSYSCTFKNENAYVMNNLWPTILQKVERIFGNVAITKISNKFY